MLLFVILSVLIYYLLEISAAILCFDSNSEYLHFRFSFLVLSFLEDSLACPDEEYCRCL